MNFVRKIAGSVCGIMIILAMCNSMVKAEDAASASIDQIQVEDGNVLLYVNHNQGEEWQIVPENSALTIAGKTCAIETVEMLKNTDTPISYVCLVDISGSMSQDRMDAVKEMLYQFVDGKKETDNFYITLMGDHLTSSDVLQNPDEIKAYIDEIAVTKEDTNLYQSIRDELAVMQNQQDLYSKKCLIIFSDGADDQVTGITREEAENAVKESNIPVFTVAMLKENPTEAQMESAKILGSFARYSAGGQHYTPVIEQYENADVYGKVQSVLNSSLIVKATVDELNITGDTANVELTLSNGTVAAATERKISGEVLASIVNLSAPDVMDTEMPEEVEEENGLDNNIVLIIVIAAVCILAIAIVIIIKIRKENLEDDLEYAKKAEVMLSQLSGIGEQHNFTIKEEIKIGRGRRCQLCLKEDAALSEVHCSLQWKQGELYVKDENSTNGTYVNGVPIVGEYKLEQGDVLLIGSYEYRVNWR